MSYRDLSLDQLKQRAEEAGEMLKQCNVCARNCLVNRLEGERRACRAGRLAVVASYGPHYGEEEVLVGTRGSGTIFFSYCNLSCKFCQNYDISQCGEGRQVTAKELADIMLELQDSGCHNVNLVSPSHFVPQILEALVSAVEDGLTVPLVYNTGGYDSQETLSLLDGVVDIYMPDIKFGSDEAGKKYTGVPDYFSVVRRAVKEMYRQVGDLQVDKNGIAVRGLLVRHLVMPHNLAETGEIMKFLAKEISPRTFVNIMDQYYPAHEARRYPEIARRTTAEEYRRALEEARRAGLTRIYS